MTLVFQGLASMILGVQVLLHPSSVIFGKVVDGVVNFALIITIIILRHNGPAILLSIVEASRDAVGHSLCTLSYY